MKPAAYHPVTGQPITELVWATCGCGASCLATPAMVPTARCASCHWEAAGDAIVPETTATEITHYPPAAIPYRAAEMEPEPVRTVDTDVRSVALMEKVSREAGWQVRIQGTYGSGTEMIGVWMHRDGVTCAAFWSRAYDTLSWKAAGTYVAGKPPFTAMNHTDLKQWIKTRDPLVVQRARVRQWPVHTCEPPDKKIARKKPTEHGG